MSWLQPTPLRGTHATLEPLSSQLHDDLTETVNYGELWKLWYEKIAEPVKVGSNIEHRLPLQAKGTMLLVVHA
jgi:hypothetical protein